MNETIGCSGSLAVAIREGEFEDVSSQLRVCEANCIYSFSYVSGLNSGKVRWKNWEYLIEIRKQYKGDD